MSPIVENMSHPLAYRLGWVLLHSLWQGALVGVVFGLCRSALKKSSPNARYLAGCIALGLLIGIPAITFFSQPGTSFQNETASGVLQNGHAMGGGGSRADLGIAAEAFVRSGTGWLWNAAPWIVALWMFGVAFFSLRLVRGSWWVRTIRTTENEPVGTRLLTVLNDLRHRFGISRPVRLLRSALVEVPTVVGWLRPVILIPAATLTGLTPEQLEAILAHELAHVRRFDYVVNAFQCLVETLMFYHPVVWWISRLVREERENCCDDLVVRVCGNRLEYARALATLEAFRSELPQLAFAASGGSLVHRIRRLFGLSVEEERTNRTRFGGLALLGVGLVLTISGAYLMLLPKTYMAEARIKMEREASPPDSNQVERDVSQPGSIVGQNPTAPYDPYFVATEFEVIKSSLVLSKVVALLGLDKSWAERFNSGIKLQTSDAVRLLKQHLRLQPDRNTALTRIQVFDNDPAEAARIANTIPVVYRDLCMEEQRKFTYSGIQALEKRYQDQEDLVSKIQHEVNQLRTNLDISDIDAQYAAPAPSLEAETLRKYEQERIEYETSMIAAEKLVTNLMSLRPEALREVLPTTVKNTTLSELLSAFNQAEQHLIAMEREYGSEHPEFIRAREYRDKINQQINNRVNGIMTSLKTQIEINKAKYENLEKRIADARKYDQEKATKSRPYYDKKRELESAIKFKDNLKFKIESEKIDMNLPKRPMVTITDMAVRPREPRPPNRKFAGALLLVGLLLNVAGLATLFTGRKTRRASTS